MRFDLVRASGCLKSQFNWLNELEELEGSIDVLVGGPPCQGFSSAGRRKHDDPRNQLFAYYLQIVKILKPKAVLIGKRTRLYDRLRERLVRPQLRAETSDYDVFEELVGGLLAYNWDTEDSGEARYFGHLAFEVDDIYAVCDRLMKAGAGQARQ